MDAEPYLQKTDKVTESQIIAQLRQLGVAKGDVLLVTADLLKVGLTDKKRENLQKKWVNLFKELVGDQGTIIVVAFTESFFRFAKNKNICFTRNSKSTSGSLARAFLDNPDSYRSTHPTNSVVAWGKNAELICKLHNETSLTYSYVGEILKLNGKHLMLGTIDKKNAPAGFHYAQEILGETKFTPGVGLLQTFYIDKTGQLDIFTRWDGGGCSGAGYKLLGHHLLNECANIGFIGGAHSALIDIKSSLNVCKSALENSRPEIVCDDKYCLTCRGRWSTSGINVVIFYCKFFMKNSIPIFRKILNKYRKK